MRRANLVSLPKGVFQIRKKSGLSYWYHQSNRGRPDQGPLVRLPEYGTPEFWHRIGELSGREPIASKGSIKALIMEYQASDRWTRLRPETQRSYGFALDAINAAWGPLQASQISSAGMIKFMEGFQATPSMGNIALAVVKVIMKTAVQKGYRTDNPAREIDKLHVDPDGAKPLTPAAWKALIEKAPEPLKRLAWLGRMTGQRISDLVAIGHANRDDDGLLITIGKLRDKQHWCPLTPADIARLNSWHAENHAAYIHKTTGDPYTTHGIREAWNAFADGKDGKPLRGFTPHDLRATKVCDERIAGKSHQQISAMVGMSIQMVMKYSAHIDQRLAARGQVKH